MSIKQNLCFEPDWLTNFRLLKKEAARRCVSRLSSPMVEYLADAHDRVLHKQAKCLRDLSPRATFQEQEIAFSQNHLGTRWPHRLPSWLGLIPPRPWCGKSGA